jgi:hypothetical protein
MRKNQCVENIQVNNYEIIVNFFHISHNLTWYSAQLSIHLPEFTQSVWLMNFQNNSCKFVSKIAQSIAKRITCIAAGLQYSKPYSYQTTHRKSLLRRMQTISDERWNCICDSRPPLFVPQASELLTWLICTNIRIILKNWNSLGKSFQIWHKSF